MKNCTPRLHKLGLLGLLNEWMVLRALVDRGGADETDLRRAFDLGEIALPRRTATSGGSTQETISTQRRTPPESPN